MDNFRALLRGFGRAFIKAAKEGIEKTAIVPNDKGVIGIYNGNIVKCVIKEFVYIDSDVACVIGKVLTNAKYYNNYGSFNDGTVTVDIDYVYNSPQHVVYTINFNVNETLIASMEIEFITQSKDTIPNPLENPVFFGEDWESLENEYTYYQIRKFYDEVKR